MIDHKQSNIRFRLFWKKEICQNTFLDRKMHRKSFLYKNQYFEDSPYLRQEKWLYD